MNTDRERRAARTDGPQPTPLKLRTCEKCGGTFRTVAAVWTPLCHPCRTAEVAPTHALLGAMTPACQQAYVQGRLAAAIDGNETAVISRLEVVVDALVANRRPRRPAA